MTWCDCHDDSRANNRNLPPDRALVRRLFIATLLEPIKHLADQFGLGFRNPMLMNAPRNRCIECIPHVAAQTAPLQPE
jgi:hypothetical protein